jgi:hypothetical protein
MMPTRRKTKRAGAVTTTVDAPSAQRQKRTTRKGATTRSAATGRAKRSTKGNLKLTPSTLLSVLSRMKLTLGADGMALENG